MHRASGHKWEQKTEKWRKFPISHLIPDKKTVGLIMVSDSNLGGRCTLVYLDENLSFEPRSPFHGL